MGMEHAGTANAISSELYVECNGLAPTAVLASQLAARFAPDDVVLLDGGLAAGKTTFISLICQALLATPAASSPTYAITHQYACSRFEIFHIDAYRLSGVDEFYQLGVDEFFPDSVSFIEWGARIVEAFPDALRIKIDIVGPKEDARVFRFSSKSPRWQPLLAALQQSGAHSP